MWNYQSERVGSWLNCIPSILCWRRNSWNDMRAVTILGTRILEEILRGGEIVCWIIFDEYCEHSGISDASCMHCFSSRGWKMTILGNPRLLQMLTLKKTKTCELFSNICQLVFKKSQFPTSNWRRRSRIFASKQPLKMTVRGTMVRCGTHGTLIPAY